jgi:3'(2'), 5'-bisphosphate nucleotidase
MTDHELASQLAAEAGRVLLRVRDELAGATAGERKAAGD